MAEKSNTKVRLIFRDLKTISVWDQAEDVYSQEYIDCEKPVSGVIDREMFIQILTLNTTLLSCVRGVENRNNEIKSTIKYIFNKIISLIDTETVVYGYSVKEIAPKLRDSFEAVASNEHVINTCKIFREYDRCSCDEFEKLEKFLTSMREAGKPTIDLYTTENLLSLFYILVPINDIVYPSYWVSMLMFLMTEFYIVFSDFPKKCSKDELLGNALFSHLQRIIYDDNSDEIILSYVAEKMGMPLSSSPKYILNRLKSNKTLQEVYPVLGLQSFLKLMENQGIAKKMYELLPSKREQLATFYKQYDLNMYLDLVPYILQCSLTRRQRVFNYGQSRFFDLLPKHQSTEAKKLFDRLHGDFEKIFNQIEFPNREQTLKAHYDHIEMMATQKGKSMMDVDKNVVRNINDFQRGETSLSSIFEAGIKILSEVSPDLMEELKSGVTSN